MARKRLTIAQWITQVLGDAEKGKPCSALAVLYVKGVGQEEIYTKQLDGEPVDAPALAQIFIDRAGAYCQDLPGLQNFRMVAFYGQNEPQAAFPFTMAEGELTAGQEHGYAKHEVSANGVLGMTMKHLENTQGVMLDLIKTYAVGGLQREAAMRAELNEANVILRDVFFGMNKEKHEQRIAELQFQRTSQERAMIGKVLPSVLNQLAGREILPQEHADTELIDGLAMKVSPESIQKLIQFGAIPADVGALLLSRFQKTWETRKREVEALKTLPPEDSEKKVE
jgi:hypothetical protein